MTTDIQLLKSILNALNMIPNKKNVGKNGESSYDLASKLHDQIQLLENKSIVKANFIERLEVRKSMESVDLYRLEGGGLVAIDSSFIETEEPVFSPFDGAELEITE